MDIGAHADPNQNAHVAPNSSLIRARVSAERLALINLFLDLVGEENIGPHLEAMQRIQDMRNQDRRQNIRRQRRRIREENRRVDGHDDTSSDEDAQEEGRPERRRQVAAVAPVAQRNPIPPVCRRRQASSAERRRYAAIIRRMITRLISRFHVNHVRNEPSRQPYYLPAKAGNLLADVRTRTRNSNLRFITYQGNRLSIDQIRTIDSGTLSQAVVSAYMEMIVSRSTREGLPSVHVADPNFINSLMTVGAKEAGRIFGRCNALHKKILFFPFLQRGYWSLTVVDMDEKTIDNYNVHGSEHPDHLIFIAEYIFRSYLPIRPPVQEWRLRYRKDFPYYRAEVSGIFVLQVAESISRRQAFERPSFYFLRKKIILELSERRFYLNH